MHFASTCPDYNLTLLPFCHSVAHKEAFENAKILHRDISVGNILITNDGHGLLIDWDLSKYIKDLAMGARQGERSVI